MWYKIEGMQLTLYVCVKPNAAQSALVGVVGDELNVRLKAKPIEGEANKALIAFMAKCLRVPKKSVVLKRGDESRHKVLQLPLTPSAMAFITSCASPSDQSK